MCRTYQPKAKPAYTRLCYRYQSIRGQHILGDFPCGTYPRPARRSTSTRNSTTPAIRLRCACGAIAVSSDAKCEQCYIDEQIARLPQDIIDLYGLRAPSPAPTNFPFTKASPFPTDHTPE